ncbi:hypothetical protein [Mycetocola zhujimingii]|uniref:Uncharacterized protein n=1 Tax=Mycetocola zhujimingii TaxID=2079792 RepID=A0A2U1TGV8_9MICO|nr:hypothetical protein [Mycetocola zhujimingii]PWC08119.1 hypothetical protein DF223_01830 [Mycetocola zhujimingii]
MKKTAIALLIIGAVLLTSSATWFAAYVSSMSFIGLLPELDTQVNGFAKLAASTFGFGTAVLAASGMVVIAYREKLRQAHKAAAAGAVAVASPQPV